MVNPRNPTILYHLDAAYHAAGEKSSAREALGMALFLSDTFEYADDARKLIALVN